MTRLSACLCPFRLSPWPIAVMLLLSACQSPQSGPWFQGATEPRPQATAPPSQATRVPADRAPRTEPPPRSTPKAVPEAQQAPPPAAQSRPQAPEFPPWSATVPRTTPLTPQPQPDQQAALPPGGAQPPPSLLPFLTPPQGQAKAPPERRSSVPPPTENTVRVALLVPLSGANASLGQAMLNAAQLAVFAFADRRFELLVHDTKGTSRGAAEAASLAIGDGAHMILGPLLSSSVQAAAPVARAANVPVVAFSSDRTVAGNGVYTMGFLPSAEVERIVAFARAKGIRRYAALAPDNPYGETVVAAFENAIAATGGILTRVQFYDPGTEDFAAVVRALADYESRREALLHQRRQLAGRTDEVSLRALKRLENLQTIGDVPFDALLVADGGKRLQSIAALLPFYDIDPGKVRILGTGRWDEPGVGAEPALVGGWFAAPPPAARADFEAEYRNTYGTDAPRLATLAYDATALAAVLAANEQGPDFSANALTAASGFWGRDGIFRFRPDGLAERGLAVLKVKRRGADVISRAPETFQSKIN